MNLYDFISYKKLKKKKLLVSNQILKNYILVKFSFVFPSDGKNAICVVIYDKKQVIRL